MRRATYEVLGLCDISARLCAGRAGLRKPVRGASASSPGGFPFGPEGDPLRRDVEAFILAFDSNLAPIVGQQITLTAGNAAVAGDRIDLLIERASEHHATGPECELVATARIGGKERGWLYIDGAGVFVPSAHGAPALTDAQLRAKAQHAPITYTCVPPGSGRRVALDADLDGTYNVTELALGCNPRDPASKPPGC